MLLCPFFGVGSVALRMLYFLHMASMSLYRKYRPTSWKEVIGQTQVVRVLERAVKDAHISHAYLFEGSRGTGKTSVARIFTQAIGTTGSDLYEIDAASNNGVDDVRDLRDGVRTLPFNSKYKVYIIDEVHMLSKAAFNALLKTLEEPPAHAIFILATTEVYKLPETVVSRCQVFKFHRPSEEDICINLKNVLKNEGYEADKGSLALIAILAEGSFRDALTILEKVLGVSKDKNIEVSEVEAVTGAPRSDLVEKFIRAILGGEKDVALLTLDKANKSGVDIKMFTKLVLRNLRYSMLIALAPDMIEDIKNQISEPELKYLKELSAGDRAKKLPNTLRAFLSAYNDIGYSYITTLPLELAVIELSA